MEENKDKKIKLLLKLDNSDFENAEGSQESTGFVGSEISNVYQLLYSKPLVNTYFDSNHKKEGSKSLRIDIKSMGTSNNAYVLERMTLKFFTGDYRWKEFGNEVKTIKLRISFWVNASLTGKFLTHKLYLTRKVDDKDNKSGALESLGEIEFDTDTSGVWKRYHKIIKLSTNNLTPSLYLYLAVGEGEASSSGSINFDRIKIKVKELSSEELHINNQELVLEQKDFRPVPRDLVPLFEDFLNNKSITDNEIKSLINDPTFPFSALLELWQREGLSFKEFIIFVHENYPKAELNLVNYLNDNGINAVLVGNEIAEKSLRDVIYESYDEHTASLLSVYAMLLLSTISETAEKLLDSPISQSLSQLLNLVASFKANTNNIDQLRALDQLESAVSNYAHDVTQTPGNVLTPQERTSKTLLQAKNTTADIQNSIADASINFINQKAENQIPRYTFFAGDTAYDPITQRQINSFVDTLGIIDKRNNKLIINKWLPMAFDTAGAVLRKITNNGDEVKFFDKFIQTASSEGLKKYSTVASSPELTDYVSTKLGNEISKSRHNIGGDYETASQMGDKIFDNFTSRNGGGDFESSVKSYVKNTVNDAVSKGWYDNSGNYHKPYPVDDDIREFMSSSAATGAYEGIRISRPNLSNVPGNFAQMGGPFAGVGVSSNMLGGAPSFNPEKGADILPFKFYPSIATKIGESLSSVLPQKSIYNLQKSLEDHPEYFSVNRLKNNFTQIPEVRKVLEDSGINQYRAPQVRDAINKAYSSQNFDTAETPLRKLSNIANEGIGRFDASLGIPMLKDATAGGNLLSGLFSAVGGAGIAVASAAAGKQKELFRNIFGPEALSYQSTNQPLPSNYEPKVLEKLVDSGAKFNSSLPTGESYSPTINQSDYQSYQKYRDSLRSVSPEAFDKYDGFRQVSEKYGSDVMNKYADYLASSAGASVGTKFTPDQVKQFKDIERTITHGDIGRNFVNDFSNFKQSTNNIPNDSLEKFVSFDSRNKFGLDTIRQFPQVLAETVGGAAAAVKSKFSPDQVSQFKAFENAAKDAGADPQSFAKQYSDFKSATQNFAPEKVRDFVNFDRALGPVLPETLREYVSPSASKMSATPQDQFSKIDGAFARSGVESNYVNQYIQYKEATKGFDNNALSLFKEIDTKAPGRFSDTLKQFPSFVAEAAGGMAAAVSSKLSSNQVGEFREFEKMAKQYSVPEKNIPEFASKYSEYKDLTSGVSPDIIKQANIFQSTAESKYGYDALKQFGAYSAAAGGAARFSENDIQEFKQVQRDLTSKSVDTNFVKDFHEYQMGARGFDAKSASQLSAISTLDSIPTSQIRDFQTRSQVYEKYPEISKLTPQQLQAYENYSQAAKTVSPDFVKQYSTFEQAARTFAPNEVSTFIPYVASGAAVPAAFNDSQRIQYEQFRSSVSGVDPTLLKQFNNYQTISNIPDAQRQAFVQARETNPAFLAASQRAQYEQYQNIERSIDPNVLRQIQAADQIQRYSPDQRKEFEMKRDNYEAYRQYVEPNYERQGYSEEQKRKFKKVNRARRTGEDSRGRKKRPPNGLEEAKRAKELERKAREAAKIVPLSLALGSATASFAGGFGALVPLSIVTSPAIQMAVNFVLGGKKGKLGEGMEVMGYIMGLDNHTRAMSLNIDKNGKDSLKMSESKSLWNATLGKIGFGKDYVVYSGSPLENNPLTINVENGIGGRSLALGQEKAINEKQNINLLNAQKTRVDKELKDFDDRIFTLQARRALLLKDPSFLQRMRGNVIPPEIANLDAEIANWDNQRKLKKGDSDRLGQQINDQSTIAQNKIIARDVLALQDRDLFERQQQTLRSYGEFIRYSKYGSYMQDLMVQVAREREKGNFGTANQLNYLYQAKLMNAFRTMGLDRLAKMYGKDMYLYNNGISADVYDVTFDPNDPQLNRASRRLGKQGDLYRPRNGFFSTSFSNIRSVRNNMSSLWGSFMNISRPLTGSSDIFSAMAYLTNTLPSEFVKVGGALQKMYGVLPEKVTDTFNNFFGNPKKLIDLYLDAQVDGNMFLNRFFNQETGEHSIELLGDKKKKLKAGQTRLGIWFDYFFKRRYVNSGDYGWARGKLGKRLFGWSKKGWLDEHGNYHNTRDRSGWRAWMMGRYQMDKLVYQNRIIRAYFGLSSQFGRASRILGIVKNPGRYLSNQIKNLLTNLIKNITTELARVIFKNFKRVLGKLFETVVVDASKAIVATFGCGCIIIGGLFLIIIIVLAGTFGSTKAAYSDGIGGRGSGTGGVDSTIPAGSVCSPDAGFGKTIKDPVTGTDVKANILDVPYANQKVIEVKNGVANPAFPGAATVPGGGNMCGAVSAVMTAAYYNFLPLDNATYLQTYASLSKGQIEKYGLPATANCSSTDPDSTSGPITGAFNVTEYQSSAYGPCQENYAAGIQQYIKLVSGDSVTTQLLFDGLDTPSLYKRVYGAVKRGDMLIVGSQPGGKVIASHIWTIIGYYYTGEDTAANVKGVIANDPYQNSMLHAGGAYSNDGRFAAYDFSKSYYPNIGWTMEMFAKSNVKKGPNCGGVTTTAPSSTITVAPQGLYSPIYNNKT